LKADNSAVNYETDVIFLYVIFSVFQSFKSWNEIAEIIIFISRNIWY